jgi:D-apionolactonase
MKNLQAGPLSLQYSDGSLWNIRLGEEEAVRRIYLVFQDINWTSRPFEILEENWNIAEDHFSAELQVRGSKDAENFEASLKIVGTPAGEIKYAFSGSTSADFMRNRLGLCLLHPIADLAGKPCKLSLSGGTKIISAFPKDISPSQPFKNLSGISHTLNNGQIFEVKFKGEVFETEDHRNWSDASYKTYCTPIELPFPVTLSKGELVEQEINISLSGSASRTEKPIKRKITVSVSEKEVSLPDLGLNIAKDFSEVDHDEFSQLGISHLRLNLDLDDFSELDFSRAVGLAKQLNLKIDLALKAATVGDLIEFIESSHELMSEVRNLLIFSKSHKVTPEEFIAAARELLGAKQLISAGTDLYFTEINRGTPVVPGIDQINFSLNPQVHSFDDRTLIQNLATQEVVAVNAARIAGDKAISVGPITLRPRFNPNATQPDRDVSNDSLPASVDARQRTWFTEAWTAISIKYLTQLGAINSATYFESVGWKGIRESTLGSKDPKNFPSEDGEAFPVWNLFSSLKGFSKSRLSTSNLPEVVDSLVIKNSSKMRLILANFSTEAQQVHFQGIDLTPVVLPPLSTTYLDI